MSPILLFKYNYFIQKKFKILKFLFDSLLEKKLLDVLSIMLQEILKFLNNINNKNPIANSNPAKPKIKNVIEIKFKSSKYIPKNVL